MGKAKISNPNPIPNPYPNPNPNPNPHQAGVASDMRNALIDQLA